MSAPPRNPYRDRGSLESRLRARRFRLVGRMIDLTIARQGRCHVLDIGGTATYWRIVEGFLESRAHALTVTLTNIKPEAEPDPAFSYVSWDATVPQRFEGFDLVHSNSVIEHMGSWPRMLAFAANVRAVGAAYYIQTPYFWFPFEPHYRTPLIHWLPAQMQYRLRMRKRRGFIEKAGNISEAFDPLYPGMLLDRAMLHACFPEAEIVDEKFWGLTKSITAVHFGDAAATRALVADAFSAPSGAPAR